MYRPSNINYLNHQVLESLGSFCSWSSLDDLVLSNQETTMHVKISSLVKKLSSRNRHEGYVKMTETEKKKAAPRGFIPVCVGEDHVRYEIPVACFNSSSFKNLLKQHEEEILDTSDDLICLLCSISHFEIVLDLAKAEAKRN